MFACLRWYAVAKKIEQSILFVIIAFDVSLVFISTPKYFCDASRMVSGVYLKAGFQLVEKFNCK